MRFDMTDNLLAKLNKPRWRIVMVAAGGVIPLAYLSYWAGVPQKGVAAFVIGLGAFLGLTITCAWLAWRFLFRPVPMDEAGPLPAAIGSGAAATDGRPLGLGLAGPDGRGFLG